MSERTAPNPTVLFVCTGNVFRSLAAEYALRSRLGHPTSIVVASAGIEAKAQPVHEWIRTRLQMKGADVSGHVPRRITGELIKTASLVIAMGRDHQKFIQREFERPVRLFNDLCYGRDEPILDLHEAIADWQGQPEQSRAYVSSVIDEIWQAVPLLFPHLHLLR